MPSRTGVLSWYWAIGLLLFEPVAAQFDPDRLPLVQNSVRQPYSSVPLPAVQDDDDDVDERIDRAATDRHHSDDAKDDQVRKREDGKEGDKEGEEESNSDEQSSQPCLADAKTLFEWAGSAAGCEEAEQEEGDDIGPIATDRPDFTESSATVGRNVWQVESGYTYFYHREQSSQLFGHSYPEILSRYGIWADWLELRLGWNFASEQSDGQRIDGAEDLYLGVKLALTEQSSILPEMALVPQMTIPTGDDAFSADTVLAGVNWLYGWDVTDWMTTAGSTQVNRAFEGDLGERHTEWAQSWTVGYSLTEHVGAYTEWFAIIPSGATLVGTEHYFNGGFTLNLFDVQWDVRAGVGLNDDAADYFAGIGLSVRLR